MADVVGCRRYHQHFHFLVFFRMSVTFNTSVAQHGDVNQTVFARQDVDECAEVDDALNRAGRRSC